MKIKNTLILLFICSGIFSQSECHNTINVVSNESFIILKESIEDKYLDDKMLAQAKLELTDLYLTTQQAGEIIDLFYMDKAKASFAIFIYPNLVDKGSFSSLKTKFHLHSSFNEVLQSVKTKHENGFDQEKYHNTINVINNESFTIIKESIEDKYLDDKMLAQAKLELTDLYLTTQQAGEIIDLFYMDKAKASFAIFIYPNLVDKASFSSLKTKFHLPSNFNEVLQSVKTKHENGFDQEKYHNTINVINNESFTIIKESIEDKYLDDKMLAQAKLELTDLYLTNQQAGEIIDLFYMDKAKVSFAIFIYPNLVDKASFSSLKTKFNLPSNFNEVLQSVKNQ